MRNRHIRLIFSAVLGLLVFGTAIALPSRSSNAQLPSPTPTVSPTPSPSRTPSRTPSPTPRASVRISDLPNGVYRFVNGSPDRPYAILTDDELLQRGGAVFLFRKTGNQIEGDFSYVDNEGICVRGTVNGNTVSGQAFPYDRLIGNTGETFTRWGPSGFLQVRRGVRAGTRTRYNSAILNLSESYRINAGERLPPTCPR